jgi:hypothetical protein
MKLFLQLLFLCNEISAIIYDTRGANLLAHCCNPELLDSPPSSSASSSSLSASTTITTETISPEASFSRIYDKQHWGSNGGGSGEGSEPIAASGAARILEHVLLDLNISTFADIGCGSFVWLSSVLDNVDKKRSSQSQLQFIGIDVVKPLVAGLVKEYSLSHPHWSFRVADVTSISGSVIPSKIDLLLCRDALQHLPLMLAVQALENLVNSDPKWLLLGSYNVYGPNCDMSAPGYFSWISLLKYPFLFPEPLATFEEGYESKRMLLYKGDVLKQVLDFTLMRERVLKHKPPIDLTNACGSLPAD